MQQRVTVLVVKVDGARFGEILAGTRGSIYLCLYRYRIQTAHHLTETNPTPMALLSSILGFSLFGLGARIGQLGIQKRNLFDSAFPHPTPFIRLSHA